MAPTITPALWFDGNVEAAVQFYVSVFRDGEILEISRFTEHGMGEPGGVMAIRYRLQGQQFLGINGGPEFRFSEAVSFLIEVDTQEEIDHYWDALTEGGEPGPCGWLKDRFGLSWQVAPRFLTEAVNHPDRERADRMIVAMLEMGKIDLAALRRAWDAE